MSQKYKVIYGFVIDVINVYNVYKKNLCKRVYYFVNVYLNKNHMSETKQNYDGKPSYSALRSIISGQDNST